MMSELLTQLGQLNQNLQQQQGDGMVAGLKSGMAAVRTTANDVAGLANDVAGTAKAVGEARFHIGMLFDPQGLAQVSHRRKVAEAQLNLHNAQVQAQLQMMGAQAQLAAVPLQNAATMSDADIYAQMQTGWGGTQLVAAPEKKKSLLDNPLVQGGIVVTGIGLGIAAGVYVTRSLSSDADARAFDDNNVIDINAASGGNY